MKHYDDSTDYYETDGYYAGMYLLTNGEKIIFPEDNLAQIPMGIVKSLKTIGDDSDWENIKIEFELTTGTVILGVKDMDHSDAFQLINAVYDITGSEYEDLDEFLGNEIS